MAACVILALAIWSAVAATTGLIYGCDAYCDQPCGLDRPRSILGWAIRVNPLFWVTYFLVKPL